MTRRRDGALGANLSSVRGRRFTLADINASFTTRIRAPRTAVRRIQQKRKRFFTNDFNVISIEPSRPRGEGAGFVYDAG